jgi:hypothetical protein
VDSRSTVKVKYVIAGFKKRKCDFKAMQYVSLTSSTYSNYILPVILSCSVVCSMEKCVPNISRTLQSIRKISTFSMFQGVILKLGHMLC